jgi:Double zinc ribbon
MKCPRCPQENPVAAQFCGQCGAQLEVLCFACQAPNPATNRFCHRCGQPLTTAAGPVSASTAVVTHDEPSVARSGDGADHREFTVPGRLEEDGMQDPDREADGFGSSGSRAKPKRLCIVSRDRLVTGEFLKALEMSLDPDDELEIIPDRRRANPPREAKLDAAERPSVDRRRHPHADSRLKMDGFTIVPAPASGPRAQKTQRSLLFQEVPIDGVSPEDLEEEERLESLRNFKRKRAVRLATSLILVGLMGAALVLVALSPTVKILVSRIRPEALPSESQSAPPRQDKESPAVAHAPSVTANVAIAQPSGLPETSSPVPADNPTGGTRESPATGLPEPTPSAPASTANTATRRAPSARVLPNPRSPAPPRPIASVPTSPAVSASSPEPVDTRITAPLSLGLPRVEVVRSDAAATGHGETYAVRISDAADQPLAGAEVSLVATMADGSVLDLPLDPGSEPGTYRGTRPPSRSALVGLRIRVLTSDKRVEVPLGP